MKTADTENKCSGWPKCIQSEYLGTLKSAIARTTVGEALLCSHAVTTNVYTLITTGSSITLYDAYHELSESLSQSLLYGQINILQREKNIGIKKKKQKASGKKETYKRQCLEIFPPNTRSEILVEKLTPVHVQYICYNLPHYESHKVDSSNGIRQTQSRVQPNVCVFASLSFCETGSRNAEDQPFAASGQESEEAVGNLCG
jgi:hypothetical protein